MSKKAFLTRRQWLGKISVPAVTAGTVLLSPDTQAAPAILNKTAGSRTFNVCDYGAKADGKTLNSEAIQKAIDACFADQGGTVLIPAGDFLCGTIELKSNVTFHITAGGRLLGSPKREHYTAGKGVPPGNGNIVFIYAVNSQRVTIEGKGTIDGNGLAFYNGKGDNTGPGQHGVGGNFDRPHLMIFYQCTSLRLHAVYCTASAYHCCRLLGCKQVYIDGVRIYNRVNRNNDGFHFNNSEYVHVLNCDVQCQDDACALFGSNQFVTITNCTFSTRWSVFRFGSGQSQNITVTNCLIYETYGCPIKISADNASIQNFTFSNIIMRNVTGPIGIGFSGGAFLRNIVFNAIRATVVAKPVDHPDIHFGVSVREGETNSCITLNGMGDSYLENISFTDVHVTYAGGGTAAQAAKREVSKVAAEYFSVWDAAPGGPPAYGMYARNVKGLTLHNVRFEFLEKDARPAIILDNVQDASFNGVSAQGNEDSELFRFINSKDVLLSSVRVLTSAATFLRIEGASSEGVTVNGGDLRKSGKLVAFENGASKDAVFIN